MPGMTVNSRQLFAIGALVGTLMTFVGSVLPWATVSTGFGTVSRNGTDADGTFTLVLAMVAAGLTVAALLVAHRRAFPIAAAVVGGIIGLIGIADLVDVQNRVAQTNTSGFVSASVGSGLWITVVGAVAVTVSAVLMAAGASFEAGPPAQPLAPAVQGGPPPFAPRT